ncbi:MAG: zinc-dependent alcohol dehydrogenase family protein [Candidatus Neomarinimicrobiota bacterium]
MRAMLLERLGPVTAGSRPLRLVELPVPVPGPGQLLIRVLTCGVCHTELDEIEGRTPPPLLPIIPGHQAVGEVAALGPGVTSFHGGERVGVAWIFSACGHCQYCRTDRENLCADFQATGRDAHGGYAEYLVVAEAFAIPIPARFSAVEAAPLLCAGAIGYRSLRLTNLSNGQNLGLTGFGASAHLVLMLARQRFPDSKIYVFARSVEEREFARELGAAWSGDSADRAPIALDAIIDTTPVWTPLTAALKNLVPGGRLVINAIRKEDTDKDVLARLDYPSQLWQEKEIKSVANVTRSDVIEFLELAAAIPIRPEVREYALTEANTALTDMKNRAIRGAKVLRIGD